MPVGHERDPVEVGTAGEVGGPGQVTVGDDHLIEAVDGQRGDAGVDRPVEAGPVDPDHGRSESLRPVGDLVVVAHHRHGQWRCGGDHRLGHPAGEVGPLARIEDRRQACLGAAERLERDQYGRLHPESLWAGHPPESVGALGSPA